jgi:hypothetical protein
MVIIWDRLDLSRYLYNKTTIGLVGTYVRTSRKFSLKSLRKYDINPQSPSSTSRHRGKGAGTGPREAGGKLQGWSKAAGRQAAGTAASSMLGTRSSGGSLAGSGRSRYSGCTGLVGGRQRGVRRARPLACMLADELVAPTWCGKSSRELVRRGP